MNQPVDDHDPARAAASIERLRRLARTLDASIGIPGTKWRIGADSLVGLIPGVGDAVGAGLAGWIVYRAHRLGVRRRTLWRMTGNVLVDALVGAIPIAGDVFDAWFKCNRRNVELLARDLSRRVEPRA